MGIFRVLIFCVLAASTAIAAGNEKLPFNTVFKGEDKFQKLMKKAEAGHWEKLSIGERTAKFGLALCGTSYESYTLEIDDRIEAPSVNFDGLDCWTFFETALGMARLMNDPPEQRTPGRLLFYIEMDRYRNGQCTGQYLSRLHYLEDWLWDNDKRGLIRNMTPQIGGVSVDNICREMTIGWKGYRYLRVSPSLLPGLREMELRVQGQPFYQIPKSRVATAEALLQNGDIIGITSKASGGVSTSHVGLAWRDPDGVVHFMHASSQKSKRKVLVDERLSDYLYSFQSDSGIIVGRPLK